MAAQPVLIVGDGVIEIPEELRGDPRFRKGAKLLALPIQHVVAEQASPNARSMSQNWRALRGSLKSLPVRLTDEMEKDRLAELASDERILSGNADHG